MTLDEMFAKEFKNMLSQRKAYSGVVGLYDLQLPKELDNRKIETHNKVLIHGVSDEYYSKLNDTEAVLMSRPDLKRRKFDYKGEFIRDKKTDEFITEEVDVPRNCVAIVSSEKIGVPLKYKPKEDMIFVDVIEKDANDIRYIYIIPKKYCYKLNQTALVISHNKMRVYYNGMGLALQNGNVIYLYTIPYKPSNSERSYRVICTKTGLDYSAELNSIRDFWLKNGVLFDYQMCSLEDGVKGRNNVAYEDLPQVLDNYIRYDPEKSLADVKEDINIEY